LPATILRPVAFMESYHVKEVEIGLLKGKLVDAVRADKPYQTIATDKPRRRYPQIRLHSLEEWLREEGWHKLGLRFRAPKD
jgi:hypothetical protein